MNLFSYLTVLQLLNLGIVIIEKSQWSVFCSMKDFGGIKVELLKEIPVFLSVQGRLFLQTYGLTHEILLKWLVDAKMINMANYRSIVKIQY